MSGRKIDDHSSWTGPAEKGGVFAKGAKLKQDTGVEGAGELGSKYPDLSEDIKRAQMKGVSKLKSHSTKEDYRN